MALLVRRIKVREPATKQSRVQSNTRAPKVPNPQSGNSQGQLSPFDLPSKNPSQAKKATTPTKAISSQLPRKPPAASHNLHASSPFCRSRLPKAIMTKAQQTISLALLVSSLYLSLYLELVPLPALIQSEIIPVLPFWALVTFGSYLLFRLGLGVFTFNDVPAAHAELMLEIDEARADLRKKGVDVD
ncbi:hypothetical protein V490_02346 [Pseudogymnoascus sp. VKM F-3557]|nr:hypothetical protein V490_02346 [Pseudogymnoascus sp. VKM F-3557]